MDVGFTPDCLVEVKLKLLLRLVVVRVTETPLHEVVAQFVLSEQMVAKQKLVPAACKEVLIIHWSTQFFVTIL